MNAEREQRERFEAWLKEGEIVRIRLGRLEAGEYQHAEWVRGAWIGWQAAERAAVEAEREACALEAEFVWKRDASKGALDTALRIRARSGDNAREPHPDTVRLDWLERMQPDVYVDPLGNWALTFQPDNGTVLETAEGPTLREAIDNAREGLEGGGDALDD